MLELAYMGPPDYRRMAEISSRRCREKSYVYHLLDGQGVVIYVGKSTNPAGRVRQHRGDKAWRGEIRWVMFWEVPSADVDHFEVRQIQLLQPKYNRAETRTGTPVSRELADLAEWLGVNPEWLRRPINGGMFAGSSELLTCPHFSRQRLCGAPECEAESAGYVLGVLKRSEAFKRGVAY